MRCKHRLCSYCKHWYFSAGGRGYSELTPGYDWSMNCMKGHWELNGYDVTAEEMRTTFELAAKCKDFTEMK